jgi:hypothetical protein
VVVDTSGETGDSDDVAPLNDSWFAFGHGCAVSCGRSTLSLLYEYRDDAPPSVPECTQRSPFHEM